MTRLFVGVSTLNQWALDFKGNYQRIRQSFINASKCDYRLGPDLEICGPSCCDNFFRPELYRHSWKILSKLADEFKDCDTFFDVGMPISYDNKHFVARAVCHKGQLKYLIAKSPSKWLERWFSLPPLEAVEYKIPQSATNLGTVVSFGNYEFSIKDVVFSHNTKNSNKKLIHLISEPTILTSRFITEKRQILENKDVILCSNVIGCDGSEVYYAGNSNIIHRSGNISISTKLFSLKEVESIQACLSFEDRGTPADQAVPESKIDLDLDDNPTIYYFVYSAACWLWDYMRRSGTSGLFLALSGGADSACVGILASLIPKICREQEVTCDFFTLKTSYLRSTRNSSEDSLNRAANIAKAINSSHSLHEIDNVVDSVLSSFAYSAERPTLALENLQARTRMAMSYFAAGIDKSNLLVLGTGNADEGAVGYFTKYDCSSSDINPIGDASKMRIREVLVWFRDNVAENEENVVAIDKVLNAVPSAELSTPVDGRQIQSDEGDLGLTYEDIGLARRRFIDDLDGLDELCETSLGREKTERFYYLYARNVHKYVILPPFLRFFSLDASPSRLVLCSPRWPYDYY